MPNLKFNFPAIYVPPASLVRVLPLGGALSTCGLTYLSKPV